MPHYICITCGTQYGETAGPPARCPICEDERQYVGNDGQQWTTLDVLRAGRRCEIRREGDAVIGIGIEPSFAIGQRALLVETPGANVLWDCVSLVDDAALAAIRERGGVRAIAISHPHYYTAMVEWSRALGGVSVFLHVADREHVMRPDPCIEFWDGATREIAEGLTLIRCGGHFAGGAVLHWAAGEGGRGALFSGDIIQVVADRRWVSFMYSYPNYIPLPAAAVRRIVDAVDPYAFECIYGAWWGAVVRADGKGAVRRSAERYLRAIQGN